ncbi:MAG: O-antigen ligase family protein [Verrucomicrobiales bacterium]|nr:O-antigen ligase family protein [Verrucomicrobiales bacterium]
MNRICRFAVITIFLAGLVTVGILGTSTSMTFVWPGYLVIGVAGIFSVIAIFRRTKYAIPSWCMIAAFAFAAYLMIRAMKSPVTYFAREDGALLITCFIAYAVFLSMLDDSRWRRYLFWCITGLLGANLIMAGIQLVSGAETWFLTGYARTFPDRIGGLFNHPEHFAGYLAFGIPFLLSAIIFGRHSKPVKIGLGAISGLCFLAILLSQSLLGVLSTLAGIFTLGLIVLVLCWKKLVFNTQKSVLIATAIFLSLVGLFVILNASRVSSVFEQKILTREGQISLPGIWSSSLEQFAEAPLIGTGSRTFYFFSRKYRPENEGTSNFETEFVHNEFLQLLADYGLIGLVLALAFLGLHLFNGFKFVLGYLYFQCIRGAILPKSDHLALVTGAIAAIASISVLCLFDFVIHIPAIALSATVLLGILACPDPMSRALLPAEEDTYIPGGSCLFVGRGLAFGCGVALTLFSCFFSRSEWHFEMARHSYVSGNVDAKQLKHLEQARTIDPLNPFIKTLSAHSYISAIDENMAPTVRFAYLEKADQFFREAEYLYPHDIDSAIAHSVILDELGRTTEAANRIREARQWAPKHGNLLIAQAEHFLRNGELERAEKSYKMAGEATVFPNPEAVQKGLDLLADKRIQGPVQIANSDSLIKKGKVKEVEVSGDFNVDEAVKKLEEKLDAKMLEIAPLD